MTVVNVLGHHPLTKCRQIINTNIIFQLKNLENKWWIVQSYILNVGPIFYNNLQDFYPSEFMPIKQHYNI